MGYRHPSNTQGKQLDKDCMLNSHSSDSAEVPSFTKVLIKWQEGPTESFCFHMVKLEVAQFTKAFCQPQRLK